MELRLSFVLLLIFTSLRANASIFDGELSTPTSYHHLLSSERFITVDLGIEILHQELPIIRNVITENSRTSTALGPNATKIGDIQSNYPDIFAQTLKIQALLDSEKSWTVALKTYLPLDGLAQMDTGNVYQPEFALYRAEGQRPRILLTSGMNINPDWRLGLGLDVGFSVTAQANVFLQSGANTVSDQRITAKVKPSFIPQGSVSFHDYSFTIRGENKAEMNLSTIAGARIFSGVSAGVDFTYNTQSALFYQPWQFEFDGKEDLTNRIALKYSLSYELWTGYRARAAIIQSDVPVNCPNGAANCNPQFSSGLAPSFKAQNILVPEAGMVFKIAEHDSIELGFRYKASIFKDLPTGNGNYLDPPRLDHLVSFTHQTKGGLEWNIHSQVSRLMPQTVVKLDPSDIGGPGYQVSGWLYGGGLDVAIPFKN